MMASGEDTKVQKILKNRRSMEIFHLVRWVDIPGKFFLEFHRRHSGLVKSFELILGAEDDPEALEKLLVTNGVPTIDAHYAVGEIPRLLKVPMPRQRTAREKRATKKSAK